MVELPDIHYFQTTERIPNIKGFEPLIEWWKRIRDDKELPLLSDVEFKDLGGWHSRLILSRVIPNEYDLEIRIIGEDVQVVYGANIKKGTRFSTVGGKTKKIRMSFMRDCIESHAISLYDGPLHVDDREHVHIRALGLPFSDLDGHLSHIISFYSNIYQRAM